MVLSLHVFQVIFRKKEKVAAAVGTGSVLLLMFLKGSSDFSQPKLK